ncbi:ABC transporter permease YtrF [Paenibacillus baekrokdamisoli]|uniref:ABC transporter permease YtrF n=1 Tax=Paenibacillus baekrokdamisoli TaxID=1712516 RepID=A0A3G9JCX7_9BACL|nr:FtsX-like permease family protein [Paenibacillus baekrokdamisoli]MBB3071693.1 acetoin utilization transport system permease protein [Paenibacillus baekrokdamisoli]BBH21798.1 ABC transporter permease YtrF [Paenibacillus baekrokdamisoli]
MMKMKDKIRFVRQNMKKNRSRVFMTILATAMGCSFLIMIASVAFGLQKSIVNKVLEDQNLTQIQVHSKKSGDSYNAPQQSDIDALKKMDHVKAVTTQRMAHGDTEIDGYKSSTSVTVTDFEQETKSGLKLSKGRMPINENETIVGYDFAKNLIKTGTKEAYPENPIGQTVTLHAKGFDQNSNKEIDLATIKVTVVGIMEKPAKQWIEGRNMYLSDTFQSKLFPKIEENRPDIKVYADSAKEVTSISKALRGQHFEIYSVADSIKQMDLVFLVMKIGLIFVGTIAVLIASIGIYNTMTMAVTERSQDIGIMKAIGAHPRTIRSIFLLESFGIGLIGVFIGAVISYALSAIINKVVPPILSSVLDSKPPANFIFSDIPLTLTLVSVVISLGVAIISGMRPAARATRIDVLRALRRDI